jgi:putative ABC transport system permease protein
MMLSPRRFLHRLYNVFRPGTAEPDLAREVASHLALLEDEFQRRGMSAEEARVAARRAFGGVEQTKEVQRDARSFRWLSDLWQDVRYASRDLARHSGFALATILILALGIGANTGIFSLIDSLLIRTLPIPEPNRLVQILLIERARRGESLSYPVVRALQEQPDLFAGVCGFSGASFSAGPRGAAERTTGAWVSGGCFQALAIQPLMGRLLSPDDDSPGAAPVAIVSFGFWERRLARDPLVIGQPILLDGRAVTIVGVTARGFTGAEVGSIADVTLPLAMIPMMQPGSALLEGNYQWLRVLARLRPGGSIQDAQARLTAVWPQLRHYAVTPAMQAERRQVLMNSTLAVAPGGTGWSGLRGQFAQPLIVLMAGVVLILLVACANVANLLLARAAARRREFALRLAIGAGRGRLVRQLLTESVLLSGCAGALGVLIAYGSSHFLLRLLSTGSLNVVALDVGPNARILGFTSAVAFVTAVLFGLIPAFDATALDPSLALTERSQPMTRGSRLTAALLVAQVALSLILMSGAGLFVRTLHNLATLDAGFTYAGVLLVRFDPRKEGYTGVRLASLYAELLDRFGPVPGIRGLSLSTNTPLSGGIYSQGARVDGSSAGGIGTVHTNYVSPRYFETLRTPILIGRDFTARDDDRAAKIVIVNESFVRRSVGDSQPLGRFVSLESAPEELQHLEIVGVVKDAISYSLREAPPPAVYLPLFQHPAMQTTPGTFEVRTEDPVAVGSALRAEIRARLPDTAIVVQPMSDQVARALVQERLLATLASAFSLLALGLAGIGLYGLLAYRVTCRTSEIGIRMALGAQRPLVLRSVLGEALMLMMTGLLIGLPLAALASRLISAFLFGLSPMDPVTIIVTTALLLVVGVVAAYLPARRAAGIDPLLALRSE